MGPSNMAGYTESVLINEMVDGIMGQPIDLKVLNHAEMLLKKIVSFAMYNTTDQSTLEEDCKKVRGSLRDGIDAKLRDVTITEDQSTKLKFFQIYFRGANDTFTFTVTF